MTDPPHSTKSLDDPRERSAAAIIERAVSRLPYEQSTRILAMAKFRFGLAPARKPRRPRKPTPAYLATLANKPGIARVEVKPDGGFVVVTGTPEPAAPENAWPLDEFRTKETKQ